MRIAAACYPMDRTTSWQEWEDKVSAWVTEAEADLLVFPEYGAMELAAIAGAKTMQDQMRAVSDAMGQAWDHFEHLAKTHAVHILAPSGPVWSDAGPRNCAMFFAPNGKRHAHDKRQLTPWECDPMGMVPGEALVLMRTALGRIGVQICYDSEFPLASRALSRAGADVILVPSATELLAGYNRVRVGAQARALEGQCITVHAPTQGEAAWCEVIDQNAGCAGIYGPPDAGFPDDGVIAQGAMNTPGWTRAQIDLKALAQVRESGGVRTFHDWDRQLGAENLSLPRVIEVDLT